MTTSAVIFGLGLALLAAFFVAQPFMRGTVPVAGGKRGSQRRQLLEHKAAVYAAIREIDTDVQVGKLEVADHRVLRQRYLVEAVAILKALDDLPPSDELDAAIEADVARLKTGGQPSATERPAATDRTYCTDCGVRTDPGDRFCAKCGARLRE